MSLPGLDPVFEQIVRLSLAALFASAARHKLADFARFRATLDAYRVVPRRLTPLAATLVGATEIALAAALLAGAPAELAAGGASALLLTYSAAIALNLARGRRDIDCGCLGPGHRQPLSGGLLARNALLVGVAGALLLEPSARAMSWLDAVSIAGGLSCALLFWHAAHALGRAPLRTPTGEPA